VSVRPYRGSFEPVGVAHPVTLHIEPLAAHARPVRNRGHRVKHDSRMLDRPPASWPSRLEQLPLRALDHHDLFFEKIRYLPRAFADWQLAQLLNTIHCLGRPVGWPQTGKTSAFAGASAVRLAVSRPVYGLCMGLGMTWVLARSTSGSKPSVRTVCCTQPS
jgi:hypothetical protein